MQVAFAFIGYTLSAAVESAPKSLDSAPLNASPERRNDLLVAAEQPQPEADSFAEQGNGDLESSATHYRGYRRAYYGGYGGYPSYGGYSSYGYGSPYYGGYNSGYGGYGGYGHRGYYGGYPSYGSYGQGYGGYGGHGHGHRGYYY